MPVRELFHLMAIVDDFDAAQEFYDRLFDPHPVFGKSWSDFDKRWASIGLVGHDLPWELMEPSKDPADAGAPLVKFKSRFGEHLHSLSWFVDQGGMHDIVRRLQAKGVRVVRADSSLIGPEDEVPPLVFTHARDTLGQLELMEREDAWNRDARFNGDWGSKSATWWRDEHPLGILRLSHVTVAAKSVDRGLEIFGEALGGQVLSRSDGEAYVLVGTETVVHLATSDDPTTPLGKDLAENGELPHQFTFLVRDLASAKAHVLSVGASILEETADTILLDPKSTFNARLAFTTTPPPNDPRA